MPSFSFTAPMISAKEEEVERQGLSLEERELIWKDVHGKPMHQQDQYDESERSTSSCPPNEIKVFLRSAPSSPVPTMMTTQPSPRSPSPPPSPSSFSFTDDFQTALAKIDKKDKRDLLHAMETVPNLVQSESNPISYFESGYTCMDEIVIRMARYWKHRRQLFGKTKAFLPMVLVGENNSSMTGVGTESLEKGFVNVLPRDENGRAVIFLDRIRAIPAVAPREGVCQALFYILQKVSSEEDSKQNGFVFVSNLNGYDLYTHFDRVLSKTKFALLRDCFPMQLKCYHICAGNTGKWVIDLVMPVLKQMAGRHTRLRMVCHSEGTSETLNDLAKNYGLTSKHQSVVIGGEVSHNCHLCWMKEQMEMEETEQTIAVIMSHHEEKLRQQRESLTTANATTNDVDITEEEMNDNEAVAAAVAAAVASSERSTSSSIARRRQCRGRSNSFSGGHLLHHRHHHKNRHPATIKSPTPRKIRTASFNANKMAKYIFHPAASTATATTTSISSSTSTTTPIYSSTLSAA